MQVINAMAADAAAVIITNTDDTGFMRLELSVAAGTAPPTVTVPTASMPLNMGRLLYRALSAGQQLTVSFAKSSLPTGVLPVMVLLPAPLCMQVLCIVDMTPCCMHYVYG